MRSASIDRLVSAARRRLGLVANDWVERRVLGRTLVVRDGTFLHPHVPDYDDAWLHACAQHSQVVFDVGSNIGQSTLLMLLSGPVKRVVLLDANWQALAVAAENLIRNQLSAGCQFVNAFVGEHSNASVDFWTVGTGAAGSMYESHARTAASAGDVRAVRTTTLDEVAGAYSLEPDLIKIDVEGAEHQVLLGARTIAAAGRTRFLIEMHALAEVPMSENAARVLAWANETGYSVWYLKEGTRLEDPTPIAHRGRCHLLVQPRAWSYPTWLAGIGQSAPLPG